MGVPITGHDHTHTHAHTHSHRVLDYPTLQVFGLGEETRVDRGNPKAQGEHANACSNAQPWNQTPNPGGFNHLATLSTTMHYL